MTRRTFVSSLLGAAAAVVAGARAIAEPKPLEPWLRLNCGSGHTVYDFKNARLVEDTWDPEPIRFDAVKYRGEFQWVAINIVDRISKPSPYLQLLKS